MAHVMNTDRDLNNARNWGGLPIDKDTYVEKVAQPVVHFLFHYPYITAIYYSS